MVDLVIRISENVFAQLEEKALEAQRPIEELAAALIEQNLEYHYDEERDPFLILATAADEAGLHSEHGDISERSRDLLHTDFHDYLTSRLREQDSDTK